MSSSDSEAFESADEDFIEAQNKGKHLKKHSAKDGISSAEKQTTKIKHVVKNFPKETINSESLGDTSDDNNYEPDQSNIKEKKEDAFEVIENEKFVIEEKDDVKLVKSTEIVKRNEIKSEKNTLPNKNEEHKIEVTKLPKMKKEEIKVEEKTVNLSEVKHIEKQQENESLLSDDKKDNKPEDDGEGWEFDDWGDNAEVQTVPRKISEEKIVPVVKPTEDNDDIGWDDWDDVPAEKPEKDLPKSKSNSGLKNAANIIGNFSKLLISPENTVDQNISKVEEPSQSAASNWSGWKPWGGVASLLTTATEGVASITSHVSSVIESGIGVPDPLELAKQQREEELKMRQDGQLNNENQEEKKETDEPRKPEEKSMILGHFVSGMTNISNRVITGGLDTLEGIGKKTMNILQENDPGLLNKRKLLMMDKNAPVLSQILREAKEKTEEAEKNLTLVQKQQYKKQLHFETLFDDYHGLVHLEALEMLSKQSAIKLQTLLAPLSGIALTELEETLEEVRELCELPEQDSDDADGSHTSDDLSTKLDTAIEDLEVPMDFTDILECWKNASLWLETENNPSCQQIHDKALRCLAQTTALAVNKMHKLAELLLIKDRHSTANEADSLVQITSVLCWHLSGIATKFGDNLSKNETDVDANSFITSTFLEGSNSTAYIQNAFQLFIPILQIGAA